MLMELYTVVVASGDDEGGAGAFACLLFLAGPGVGFAIWAGIKAKYRNRAARYMPDRVVHHSVTRLESDDAFKQKFRSRQSSIEGRNEKTTHVRARITKAFKQ